MTKIAGHIKIKMKGDASVNRILKTVGMSLAILALSITTCFAAQNNGPKQIMDIDSINNSSDKDDLFKAFDNNESKVKDLIKQSDKININGIKKDNSVKAYKLNTQDIVSSYKKSGSFEKLISNKYVWMAPIIDNNSKLVSILTMDKGITVDEFNKLPTKYDTKEAKDEALVKVKENEGKWFLSKISNDLAEDQFNFISNSSTVQEFLLDNNIKNPSQIKFVLAESHFTNFLYIKDGNNEYGIPFGARPDLTGLQNGKLYSVTEIISTLGKMYSSTNNDTDSNGGGFISSNTRKDSINTYAIAIVSLFSIALLFVFFHTRKLKNVK